MSGVHRLWRKTGGAKVTQERAREAGGLSCSGHGGDTLILGPLATSRSRVATGRANAVRSGPEKLLRNIPSVSYVSK